jgi:bacillithiol biosynthesis cysteine-adding enzyme BshC
VLPVRAECLPFSQIPHTTRLFHDFLHDHPKVRQFYPHPPRLRDFAKGEASRICYDASLRARVADVLERQNRAWKASSEVLENISRLRRGALVVVTGQQVGLFGGPLFALFKALTAVKLAAEASAAGVQCVPVFWLATEDHDLEEVNHVFLPGPNGSLKRLETPTHGLPDAPIRTVQFGDEIVAVVTSALETLGESEVSGLLRESYCPGQTLGSAFARLFSKLFGKWGVILLDQGEPELHTLARPIYRAALEQAVAIDRRLLERGEELTARDYHEQVRVTPSSTLLFTVREGARVPIHRNGENGDRFEIAGVQVEAGELLAQIEAAPHQFSPNVLLRPVVQDYLLPTLTYTGGPAEVAYFAQAAVVYEALLHRVTPVLPRFSATLVEPRLANLLERYALTLPDTFHGEEALRQKLAAHALPAELQGAFDSANSALENSLSLVRDALARLDVTLVDAAKVAESKMRHQLDTLRARAARAELTRGEVLSRHAALLSNTLYPNKGLQEREAAGVHFLAKYGVGLLQQLYDLIHTECLDHQVIYL